MRPAVWGDVRGVLWEWKRMEKEAPMRGMGGLYPRLRGVGCLSGVKLWGWELFDTTPGR